MDYLDWKDSWENLVTKCENEGYDKLTSDERVWYNIRSLIDAVDNGGVISFYYNYGANYLNETLEDLKKIEAQEVIGLVEQVNGLFPNSMPPRDIDDRNSIINSWDDEGKDLDALFESVDNRFYELEEELELKLESIVRQIITLNV